MGDNISVLATTVPVMYCTYRRHHWWRSLLGRQPSCGNLQPLITGSVFIWHLTGNYLRNKHKEVKTLSCDTKRQTRTSYEVHPEL